MTFEAVSSKVDIQKVEQEVLDFWRQKRIFQRSMSEREGNPTWVTFEGPPTVNGRPGIHHVLARAFKDMFPRYKTMRGYYVLRKGGWDTHGLPVEIALEKELNLPDKQAVEQYGIAEFNEKARNSVMRNISVWEKFTDRMAYWTDLDNAYVTFTNDYVESIWWILKQLFEKDLIYKGFKVVPFCTRCGTPLSSHEVSQGYKDVTDPSVFVRFPLRDKPGVYFLAWTTTPWTLPGNVALAIGADIDYVQVEGPTLNGEGTEQLILAEALLTNALEAPENYTVVRRYKGKELAGMHYNPLYTYLPVESDHAYVVTGDFVSTADGTGIVHIAPAFGADDLEVGRKYGLPVLRTVGINGKFIDAVTPFRGLWFKDADPVVIRDLKSRGLLYKSRKYTHNYPHCWRDDTPLMYLARDSWFIATTKMRQTMIDLNQTINWVPGHIRDGRFGNWLDELKDWALGRERYWGTPLPIWIDDVTGELMCVGSVAELSQLSGRDLSQLDLHRPHVVGFTFPNPKGTGGTMRRVPEVIDVWFDSGSMPMAQWGYPAHNQALFDSQFPADYICEAVDQTRGWFYTLHSISSMLFEQVAYKNVICLGHILDVNGEKMSKSKGNTIEPMDVMNLHGADATRWYIYTAGQPGDSRRFSMDLVGDVVKKFWSTLWNTYSFFVTYANIDGWTPDTPAPAVAERDVLDQWALAELHQLVRDVTEAYETYDVTGATRPVQAFVEELSNWYVRLSRRRFWKSSSDADKFGAYATLYECLVTVAKLIAPAMPLLSDKMYRNLVARGDTNAPESVHLAQFPEANPALINQPILDQMRVVMRLVSLGRAARDNAEIGVRQPLATAQFLTREPWEGDALLKLAELVKSELNVKNVVVLQGAADVVTYALNPLPRLLGKKFGGEFPALQKQMREGDPAQIRAWAQALQRGESITLDYDGKTYSATPEEVEVKQLSAEGYAVAEDNGYLAALDTTLTEPLMREGLAREVVRRIQSTRKDADFEIEDTIAVVYEASDTLTQAIEQFADYIKTETLAVTLERGAPVNGYYRADFVPHDDPKQDTSVKGEALALGVKRAAR
ncbi:MAG: isoleucine--tRNA ligase [Armatimonadetes bacterium]|nr:isoleucine--tRNA ligase [Anaerolineae bacterium]